MKKDIQSMSPEEKIDFLIEKVQKIERTVNPPLWKVLGKWALAHIPLLIAIGLLGYAIWVLRDEIQTMMVISERVQTEYTEIKSLYGEIKETVQSLKFWK